MGLVVIYDTYSSFSGTGYKVAPGTQGSPIIGVFRSTNTLRAGEDYTERMKEIPGI